MELIAHALVVLPKRLLVSGDADLGRYDPWGLCTLAYYVQQRGMHTTA